jgi:hypothetical protein
MPHQPVDRREFAKLLAAGTAGMLGGAPATAALADEPPSAASPLVAQQAPPPGNEPGFGPPPPEVLLVAFLHHEYAHEKLTVDLLERIEGDVVGQLRRGRRLARHPFTNADEPAPIFAAYRAEG